MSTYYDNVLVHSREITCTRRLYKQQEALLFSKTCATKQIEGAYSTSDSIGALTRAR